MLWLSTFGEQSVQIVEGQEEPFYQGWYAEEFGHREANSVLSLGVTATLPITFGYVIAKHEPVQLTQQAGSDQLEICLYHQQQTYSLVMPIEQPPKFL